MQDRTAYSAYFARSIVTEFKARCFVENKAKNQPQKKPTVTMRSLSEDYHLDIK